MARSGGYRDPTAYAAVNEAVNPRALNRVVNRDLGIPCDAPGRCLPLVNRRRSNNRVFIAVVVVVGG